jgi:hypothetical protein
MGCSQPGRLGAAAVTVQLAKASDGSWTGSGLDFSVAGRWKVEVAIQEETKGTVVSLELTIPAGPAP